MADEQYAQGGYIGDGLTEGAPIPFRLHPDECLFSLEDVSAGRWYRCSRAGHPTETSDCARRE